MVVHFVLFLITIIHSFDNSNIQMLFLFRACVYDIKRITKEKRIQSCLRVRHIYFIWPFSNTNSFPLVQSSSLLSLHGVLFCIESLHLFIFYFFKLMIRFEHETTLEPHKHKSDCHLPFCELNISFFTLVTVSVKTKVPNWIHRFLYEYILIKKRIIKGG